MEPDLVMVDAFRVLRDFNGKPRHQATPGDITRKKASKHRLLVGPAKPETRRNQTNEAGKTARNPETKRSQWITRGCGLGRSVG